MNDHPELATLKSYLNNSAAAEFGGLRLHLAQCPECRAQLEGLMMVQQISQLSSSDISEMDALTEQQHQQITDYIDGRLSNAEHQQQQAFIHSNPSAMKAALHYASHKSAMDKAALKSEAAPAENPVMGNNRLQPNVLQKLKELLSFQAPLWLTLPATAALVALISFNLFDQPAPEQSLYTIASYQDNAVIQFRSKDHLPGIGFFAKSAQLSEAYDRLKISVSEDKHFVMQWPPVPGAIKYTLRLQMFDYGNKIIIGEVTTEKNSAVISAQHENIYHRYEWVLSGETSDNRVFLANGGFVINHSEKGVMK